MNVLSHLIYEYHKKLRNLALYTFPASLKKQVESKLRNKHIDYVLQEVSPDKYNVFFGETPCVDIIRIIGKKPLNLYTPEEDFILGIMLGYDRLDQCRRYTQHSFLNHFSKVS